MSVGQIQKIDPFGTDKIKNRKQKEKRQSYLGEQSTLLNKQISNDSGGAEKLGENRTAVGRGVASAGRIS